MEQAKELCSPLGASVRQVMEDIDRNKAGISLVVGEDGRLVGTITDGNVRRFILSGGSIEAPAERLVWRYPVTAPAGTPREVLAELLETHKIRNIPLLDHDGRPVGLFTYRELLASRDEGPCAAILAGGEGTRLRPLTESIPKPMVSVGGSPLLENLVASLVRSGFKRLFLAVNYKAEMIEQHFGDGSRFGAAITYLREESKLGTAGPLGLLPPLTCPLLVTNGDLLTTTDFGRLYEFHGQHRCVMTVAGIEYKVRVPFGVLRTAGHYLLGMEEKPEQKFLCNGGIYVLNPELVHLIPAGRRFDMTDLLAKVLQAGLPVATFPVHEYWVDIGHITDLEKAQRDYQDQFGPKAAEGE